MMSSIHVCIHTHSHVSHLEHLDSIQIQYCFTDDIPCDAAMLKPIDVAIGTRRGYRCFCVAFRVQTLGGISEIDVQRCTELSVSVSFQPKRMNLYIQVSTVAVIQAMGEFKRNIRLPSMLVIVGYLVYDLSLRRESSDVSFKLTLLYFFVFGRFIVPICCE